jgi:hypothetical protein
MPVSSAAAVAERRDNKTKQGDRHDDFAGELRVAGECNNGSHYMEPGQRALFLCMHAAPLHFSLPLRILIALSLYLGPLLAWFKVVNINYARFQIEWRRNRFIGRSPVRTSWPGTKSGGGN